MAELSLSPDPTAVMGRRAFAALIDISIVSVAVIGSILAFGQRIDSSDSAAEVRQKLDFVRDDTGNLLLENGRPQLDGFTRVLDLGDLTIVFQGLASVLAAWMIPLLTIAVIGGLMQGRSGVTPGKAICRLQTVDELGHTPGVAKASLRTVAWLVDGFPFLIPLVGPILSFSSPGHQRLGDRFGRTFVVERAFAGEHLEIPGLSAVDEPGGPSRQVVFNRATRRAGTTVATAGLTIKDQDDQEEVDVASAPVAGSDEAYAGPHPVTLTEEKATEEVVEEEYLAEGDEDDSDEEFADTAIDRDAIAAELASLDLASLDSGGEGLRRRRTRRDNAEESSPAALDTNTDESFTVEVDDEVNASATVDLNAAIQRRRANRRNRADDDSTR